MVISGASAGSTAAGLDFGAGSSGSTIQSLVLNGFAESGIVIASSSKNDTVVGCYIGANQAGTAAVPNGVAGIDVEASGATIGGTTTGDGNVISGNTNYGVDIDASSCLVVGNEIGTNAAGTAAVPNGVAGIYVEAPGATIGGTTTGAGNTISGNGKYTSGDGLDIDESRLVEGNLIGTSAAGTAAVPNGFAPIYVGEGIDIEASCLVEGNLIGTSADGTAAVPNGVAGIYVGASGATIGGTTTGAGNTISGNDDDGIDIEASCLVEGNSIGTNPAGTAAVPNRRDGIYVGASGATIGGTTTSAGNTISGNDGDGIDIEASGLVEGNLIGTSADGTAAVPNGFTGIVVDASGATIGGTTTSAGNTISGNDDDGIDIYSSCLVEGNLIGTTAAGTAAVPNGFAGIDVDASGVTIGGTTTGAGNTISGNDDDGIGIYSSCLVEGNLIGTTAAGTAAVPNGYDGIYVDAYDSPGSTIGGTTTGAGNTISDNGQSGVDVAYGATVTITNDSITGDGTGILVGIGASDTCLVTAQDDDLSSNATAGITNNQTGSAYAVTATSDWWGSPLGPTTTANPGGNGTAVSGNVSFTPWIGVSINSTPSGPGFDPTGITLYGVPTQLVFVTEPSMAAEAGDAFARQPVVEAEDASGDLGINFDGSTVTGSQVTLTQSAGSSAGTLSGINTVDASGGYATFSGLSISLPGVYTLAPSALAADPWSGLITTNVPSTSITVADPPTSAVNSLTTTTTNTSFTVSWSGTAGAGATSIASYTIYDSEDGGPFTAFLTNTTLTSTTFTGQVGHTYGFYSVATDNLGDVQPTPTGAQATITIVGLPTSAINSLPVTTTSTMVTVSWSGTAGVGATSIASYTIYDSEDGGPFAPFLTGTTSTSTTFTGTLGHTYGFYSVATDNLGDVQPTPTGAQATITIAGLPTSAVNSLPATTTTTSFTVSWSGSPGPGATSIASYTIFESEDSGQFTPFLTGTTLTSTTFTGQFGHTYQFYSLATDNLGDVQQTPGAQATTYLAGLPTSEVNSLPATTTNTNVTVSWSGTPGPGATSIASYTIYESEDGGPFAPFLTGTTSTSTTFTGTLGHTYGFYSVATDNLGDVQPTPTGAQATITIAGLPTSAVNSLPATTTTTSFTVSWSGSPGPGATSIASYTIFESEDSGQFSPFLTGTTLTSTTFTGQFGHTYRFYSVATDNLRNVQPTPGAQATTYLAGLPTSTVNSLPASTTNTRFTVSWSGTAGAGATSIASYTIYEAEDGGPFTAFLTNTTLTSTTFTGQVGHTYGFYSVATDNLGDVQLTPTPAVAQATITIAGLPTSAVNSLPATTTSTSFIVSWSGSPGPGATSIASYTIYDSEDGGPFAPFLTGTTLTSTTFTGQPGHTYRFYSVATDNLGNVQPTPAAQATTYLAGLPTSAVNSLPATTTSTGLTVSWSGTPGTGATSIASYTIYESEDGGPFTAVLTNTTLTSTTFTGQVGHTYSFKSVATDNLGDVQPTPTVAQATTTVITTPTSTSKPTPTPTQTVIIGEQAIVQRKLNKKGKPTGKAILGGFMLDYSVPLNSVAASELSA